MSLHSRADSRSQSRSLSRSPAAAAAAARRPVAARLTKGISSFFEEADNDGVCAADGLLGHWLNCNMQDLGFVAMSINHNHGILTVARYGEDFQDKVSISDATPIPHGCWMKHRYTTVTSSPDGSLEVEELGMDGGDSSLDLGLGVRPGGYAAMGSVPEYPTQGSDDDLPTSPHSGRSDGFLPINNTSIVGRVDDSYRRFERHSGSLQKLLERISDALEDCAGDTAGPQESVRSTDMNPVESFLRRVNALDSKKSIESRLECFRHIEVPEAPLSAPAICGGLFCFLSAVVAVVVLAIRCSKQCGLDEDCMWRDVMPASAIFWCGTSASCSAVLLLPHRARTCSAGIADAYIRGIRWLRRWNHTSQKVQSGSVDVQIAGLMHRVGGRIVTHGTVCLCGSLVMLCRYAPAWYNHVAPPRFALASQQIDIASDLMKWMHDNLGEEQWCTSFGFLPMPYCCIFFKLIVGSVLQDFCMDAARRAGVAQKQNLYCQMQEPAPWMAILFFCYQTVILLLAYYRVFATLASEDIAPDYVDRLALPLAMRVTMWDVYRLAQQSAVLGSCQLIAKLFVETNVQDDGTPPELFRAIVHTPGERSTWSLPKFLDGTCKLTKAKLFWMTVAGILPIVALAIPHLLMAGCYIFVAASFPVWGTLLSLVVLVGFRPFEGFSRSIICAAAEAHLNIACYLSALLVMVLVAIHFRCWIWAQSAAVYGRPVGGRCGYLTLITTIFWTGIAVLFLQAFVGWGFFFWSFCGMKHRLHMPESAMIEFNSRQVKLYFQCMTEELASLRVTAEHVDLVVALCCSFVFIVVSITLRLIARWHVSPCFRPPWDRREALYSLRL